MVKANKRSKCWKICSELMQGSWSHFLPLVMFSYNNNYQATIGMVPYEALYGRKCHSPVHWDEAGENKFVGPDMIEQTTEAIKRIQARMKASQSCQKKTTLTSVTHARCDEVWK